MNIKISIAAFSLIVFVSAKSFSHGRNALNGAGDIAAIRPQCKSDRHGNKHVPCPSPDELDVSVWPCVKMADLCNMQRDCPNGEDEHYLYCFYHKFRAQEINKLRQSVDQIKG
uniref:Uncharacterized protein n=2 Tax=Caenorhabditis japonica TaxID=281687 RepID=A0A8R1EVP5_CAEJA